MLQWISFCIFEHDKPIDNLSGGLKQETVDMSHSLLEQGIYKVIHTCHGQNIFFVKRDNHPLMSEDYI